MEEEREPLQQKIRGYLNPTSVHGDAHVHYYHDSVPSVLPERLCNVPYWHNAYFTGREEILEQLHARFQRGNAMTLALSGLGGIGKTQIAVEYAYHYREDYRVILWAHAESRGVITSSFVEIAGLLKLPQKDAQDQMLKVEAVKTWLQANGRWLLILDNVDELGVVKKFLPTNFDGHILLTTRAQALGGLAQRIEVDTFTPELGALFLLRRATLIAADGALEQATLQDREVAVQISEELGGLPLALDHAGGYVEQTRCISDYQSLYCARRFEMFNKCESPVDGSPKPDYLEAVATTWSLSFEKVERTNPAATELLRFCAFLAPDDIPEKIIPTAVERLGRPLLQKVADSPTAMDSAIAVLGAYSLIRRDGDEKTLSVHRLVQAVLRDAMSDGEAEQWAERIVRAVNMTFSHVQHQERGRLLPHALHCAELIAKYGLAFPEVLRFLNQTAGYLREYARYEEAERLYRQALNICERAFPQICEQALGKGTQVPLSDGKLNATHGPPRQQDKDAKAEEHKIMKKLINDPKDIVKETLEGMLAAHSDLIGVDPERRFVVRKEAPAQNKVRIVSGGGSGHEPLHSVGFGALDAACFGSIFTSPTEDQLIAATHAVGVKDGASVLYIVKNYLGDKSNFMSAVVELAASGIKIAVVFVNDDVADSSNRRGMGLTVLLEKIVGGFAETGASLDQVEKLAKRVNENGRSMGMALTSCTLPATRKPLFELSDDEMTIGIGIHGQRGYSPIKLKTANEITEMLVSRIVKDLGLTAGEKVLAMVNGMGGTPLHELYIVFNALKRDLNSRGITITRQLVGNYITSLEMAGCSITLLRLDNELTKYWDAPVHTPAFWRSQHMDPITTAIVAALSAGAISGITNASKTAINNAYNELKDLLSKKFGASSDVVQALDKLEAKPASAGRQGTLAEEVKEAGADQDGELLALVEQIRHLLKEHARENAAVQQIITGSYDATSVHGNATITVDHFKGFL